MTVLYKLIQWFYKQIDKNVDNEKMREFSRKRWEEYLEKYLYEPTPEQKQYNITVKLWMGQKYLLWVMLG